jgi:hypothetical protein
MPKPNILFLTSPASDYLADSLLHGLRSLLGGQVVDYPRCDVLYRSTAANLAEKVHGKGFTCYGLLDDIPVDRYDVLGKVQRGHFDLVIFSSIHRQFGLLVQLLPWLRPDRTLVVDGEDDPALFPYRGLYWRHPAWWTLPRAHKRFPYFKREWTPDTVRYRWFLMLPRWLAGRARSPRSLRPISFSIPEEKIVLAPPEKTQLLARHIVDPAIAAEVPGSSTGHLFDDEGDYYADLRASRFGITTRRAGWDCIRHYEQAASGCVPCFRDLDRKPATCAPHGLDETNSVCYHGHRDLMAQIEGMSDDRYAALQSGAIAWARRNTTLEAARRLLEGDPGPP